MGARLARERRNEQNAPALAAERVKQDLQNGIQLAFHPPQNTEHESILSPEALPDNLPKNPSSSSISQPQPRQQATSTSSPFTFLDAARELPPAPLSGTAKFWYPDPGLSSL